MATTISTSGTVGATLTSVSQNPVTVTGTGTVDVSGTYASAIYGAYGIPGTITNSGLLEAPSGYGIFLLSGGQVTNGAGARITGGIDGVKLGLHGFGAVSNLGTIASTSISEGVGVLAVGSANVVNGSTADTSALISGYFDGVRIDAGGYVHNFGIIRATGTSTTIGSSSVGVYLTHGGRVTNGSATDISASITGVDFALEIDHSAGTVVNYGFIKGIGPLGRGVIIQEGGTVDNGKSGYIGSTDRNGVYLGGPTASQVVNFGVIRGARSGVDIHAGGTVTNGSNSDKTASITGGVHGVYIAGFVGAAVNNYGAVTSTGTRSAISLYLGGRVTNGSSVDTTALIGGFSGIYAGGHSTITNFGVITGNHGSALSLRGGATVVNGSAVDNTAKITATGTTSTHSGIYNTVGLTTVTNFGTVSSQSEFGIDLKTGGVITNGSTADKSALILGTGHAGVFVPSNVAAILNFGTVKGSVGLTFTNGTTSATATVTNAGSIVSTGGTAGTAILFGSGNDRLIIDPGAVFVGKVFGGAGANVLELAASATPGTIGGIGSEFVGLQHGIVDVSAHWNIAPGGNTISKLTNDGTLAFEPNGTLTVTGLVDPASSGLFLLENSGVLEVAADTGAANKIEFLNPSRLIVDTAANFGMNVGSTLYTGPLIESFGTGDSILLKNILAAGAVLNYSTASGLLQLTGSGTATLLFQNSSLGAGSFHVTADGSGHAVITHNS